MSLSAGWSVSMRSDRLPRVELLHVLMLPDFDRVDRIGEFWGYPESRVRLVRNRIEHEVGLESCFLH